MNLSPIHIYRETNFPLQHISFLLNKDIMATYKEYLENYGELTKDTSKITNLLEKEIKEMTDDTLRKKAINLKRDIYNQRPLSETKISVVSQGISSRLLDEINSLAKKQRDISQEYSELKEAFELIYLKERENIKDIFTRDDELRNSIILTNDTIIAKLQKYLLTPIDEHDRNLIKLDSMLVRFLTRAVMKTSPMANLTYSGVGAKDIDSSMGKKLYSRISNNVILKMFDELCKEDNVKEQLTYRLCKTLIEKEGRYYATVLTNSTENTSLYKSKQILNVFGSNEIFDKLFHHLEENKTLTFNDMVKFLETLKIEREKAKNLLSNLIAKGILERTVYLDEHADNIIGEMVYYLENFGYNRKVINELKEIEGDILRLENSINYEKIMVIYSKIESLVEKIPVGKLTRRNLLYIDGINHTINGKYEELTSNIIDNLMYYQFIAIALDPIVRLQFSTGEEFKNKYGEEIIPETSKDISRVLRDLSSMFLFDKESTNMFLGEYNWDRRYENKEIQTLHEAAKNVIYKLKDEVGSEEIVLKEQYLKEIYEKVKQVVSTDLISHSFFLQKPEEDKVIINHLYKGYGIYFSRFLKYFKSLGVEYKDYIDKYFNKAGIADIRNTFGFNANVRTSLFNREFTLPINYGEETADTLNWDKVGFRYNEKSKKVQIFNKKTKEIIRPQYLGTLVSLATPSIMNIFDMLVSHSTVYTDLGEILIRSMIKQGAFEEDKILRIPRISLGDKGEVVISRGKWLLNSNLILDMYDKNNKFETWRKIVNKFEEEKIPMCLYLRSYSLNIEDVSIGKSDRKPQFINLASPHLLDLLMQTLQRNKHIILEEEFPIAESKDETVKEYIYEITHEGDVKNESA